jgi:hypothetical protein
MNALWSYFWPIFGFGLIAGVIAGSLGFRLPRLASQLPKWRRRRLIALTAGAAICSAGAALWHGPLGGADVFTAKVERSARATLDAYEMNQVTAHLHRAPLTRRLVLAGAADDFQTSELVRIMGTLPGVSRAQWTAAPAGPPLLLEAIGCTLLGFLFGLLLAYLVELRRRYNAQWNW